MQYYSPQKATWIFEHAFHGVNPTRQLFCNVPTRLNPTRQLLFLFAPWTVLRFYGRCRNVPTRFLRRNITHQPHIKVPRLALVRLASVAIQHPRIKLPGLILARPAMHARVSTIHSISKYQVSTIYALMCAPFGGTQCRDQVPYHDVAVHSKYHFRKLRSIVSTTSRNSHKK